MCFLRQWFAKKNARQGRAVRFEVVGWIPLKQGSDLLAFAFTTRILFEFHLVFSGRRLGLRIGFVLFRHFFFTRGASTSQGHAQGANGNRQENEESFHTPRC